jgi:hypothetical protein
MKKYFKIIFLVTLFFSCKSTKERLADKFFSKWELESKQILSNNSKNQLEKNISEISSLITCNRKLEKKTFPKLKYKIINKDIIVSMVMDLNDNDFKEINAPLSFRRAKYIFKDSIFINSATCNKSNQKLLILTDYYKKNILSKLRYGFSSFYKGKNDKNARVLLNRDHRSKSYEIIQKIGNMTFNKSQDSVIVDISRTYTLDRLRYVKVNDKWFFDKTILLFTE